MNQLNRRQFLVQGGVTLSLGAVIAACGGGSTSSPGRLGQGDTGATLPAVTVDDAVLFRTAQSLHYSAADVHQRVIDSGLAPTAVVTALQNLITIHRAQADQLGLGTAGNPYNCANPFAQDRYTEPAFTALETSSGDGAVRDAVNISLAFEEWVARSHQDMASALTEGGNRQTMLAIGTAVARQSVALSVAAERPTFEPTLFGEDPVEKDDDGFPIFYTMPARFGQVTGITLVVGELDDDGQRFNVNMQTPADNTYVLPEMSCS